MKVVQLLDLGTLVAPHVQGHGLPLSQELGPYHCLFSGLLELAIRRLLWPVFLRSCSLRRLEGSLARGPSLLFGASGT